MGKTKTAFVSDIGQDTGQPHSAKASRGKEKPQVKPEKVHIAGLKGGQRIKAIDVDLSSETSPVEAPSFVKASASLHKPRVRSKKYNEVKAKVKHDTLYPLPEAIKLVKDTSFSKFDGAFELHLVLKKVGIKAQINLPFPAGKEKKIEVASEETLKKLATGKIDFDVLLATAEMMPKLVPFAKILGPKGLMPNPKNGTLIKSEKEAGKFTASSVNLKTEKEAPLIHTVIGKISQKDSELAANLEAVFAAFGGPKQILKAYAKATMGPSVKIKIA